jgi:hypothetical protein
MRRTNGMNMGFGIAAAFYETTITVNCTGRTAP